MYDFVSYFLDWCITHLKRLSVKHVCNIMSIGLDQGQATPKDSLSLGSQEHVPYPCLHHS